MTQANELSRVSGDSQEPDKLVFESALSRLNEIVERLERGELPLEDSLRLFEEGIRLARTAQARLDSAEKRVEELLGFDEQGNPVVRKLGSDPE